MFAPRNKIFGIKCDCHRAGCSFCDSDGSITRHQNEMFDQMRESLGIKKKLTLNEVKKILYKENPKALLEYIRKGHAYYSSQLSDGKFITFEIPIGDMGDADFRATMDGKLLIRWIIKDENIE